MPGWCEFRSFSRTLARRASTYRQFLAIAVDQLGLRTERSMHGELPVVHEERLAAIAVLQPSDSLFRHAIFDMFAGLALFEVWICITPRRKVTGLWSRSLPVRNVHIESDVPAENAVHVPNATCRSVPSSSLRPSAPSPASAIRDPAELPI